jgi:hypothetical protein
MVDASEFQPTEHSRRLILRNLVIAAGSAAVLAASTSGNHVAAAETKVTQKAVAYQDTPKGTQRCDNCTQFVAPSSCMVVEGSVKPAGWCGIYVKKPA